MNVIDKYNILDMQPELRLVVRALAKAIGPDTRDFIAERGWDTFNSLVLVRGDLINTNLRNMVVSDTLELRHFKRYVWTGHLLIDRKHKITITISARSTLNRVKKVNGRKNPYYLQSLCHTLNGDLEANCKQITIADIEGVEMAPPFAEEVYEADFESIVDAAISQGEGYRHCLIAYEAEGFELKSTSLMVLDKDLDVVCEYSIIDLLEPDFGNLTAPIVGFDETPQKIDAHSLINVKAGLKSKHANEPERKLAIQTKSEEGAKQA